MAHSWNRRPFDAPVEALMLLHVCLSGSTTPHLHPQLLPINILLVPPHSDYSFLGIEAFAPKELTFGFYLLASRVPGIQLGVIAQAILMGKSMTN